MNLESMLEALADDVQFPAAPQFAMPSAPSRVHRAPVRPWLIAAVIALVIFIATLVNPDARRAVADWLGIGSIRIDLVDELLDRGEPVAINSSFLVGERTDVDDLQFPTPILGLPDADVSAAYQRTGDRAVMITLYYPASESLPAIGESDLGAVLMQVDDPRNVFDLVKQTMLPNAEPVPFGDRDAFWITSGTLSAAPYDPGGIFGLPRVSRVTGNVLLWEVGGISYRLETGLDRVAAVRLAESLVPLDPGTDGATGLYGRVDSHAARKDVPWFAASLSSLPSRSPSLPRRSPPVVGPSPRSPRSRRRSGPAMRSRSISASCSMGSRR
jgi:hypothetical protein